jgi:hypothetical protein
MSERKAVVVTVLVAAAGGALTLLIIVAAGWSPDVGYVMALAAGGAVVFLGMRRSLLDIAPPTWTRPTAPQIPPGGVDPRVGAIELMLKRGVEDAGICRRRVQPMLFDLATHRLRHDRGVELIEEPEQALALLGEQPFGFLTEVVTAPISTTDLEHVVTAIEQL